jgi:hypothetical protein
MSVDRAQRRRYLFALAGRYHLTQQERLELTEQILRRDVYSWNELSTPEMARLVDVFEGHALLQHLLETRSHA